MTANGNCNLHDDQGVHLSKSSRHLGCKKEKRNSDVVTGEKNGLCGKEKNKEQSMKFP